MKKTLLQRIGSGSKKKAKRKANEKAISNKLPQVSIIGLSDCAQNLVWKIQHELDSNQIIVPQSDHSWQTLVSLNPILNQKKTELKEVLGGKKFTKHELNSISDRICSFVKKYQPEQVMSQKKEKEKIII
ncbi:MAG: hypothetical protein WCH65_06860 [bacterium]